MYPRVDLYTEPGCPHCAAAKEYLASRGVLFRERDVTQDLAARLELQSLNVAGVPVVVIGRDAVFGFDRERIDDLLKAKGVPAPAGK
ncbi:MAG TPA: glutaredoxin domain-containing protein [Gemmataceae bacterium]|nr:glutaredoxin domain-containing protein [Gemmataceae bacterium]